MKFYKGGYQILDLTGVSETPDTFKGAYKKVLSDKPILVKVASGFKPFFASVSAPDATDGSVTLQTIMYLNELAAIVVITITPADSVSLRYVLLAQPEAGE